MPNSTRPYTETYSKAINHYWVDGDTGFVFMHSPNTGGHIVKFDADKIDELRKYRWHPCGRKKYARNNKVGKMHVFLFPDCPDGLVRDHINHDGFDNRSDNIRFVTQHHNLFNRRSRKYPSGVRPQGRTGRFNAYLSIGSFDTPEEAHEAWKDAYKKVLGDLPECVSG